MPPRTERAAPAVVASVVPEKVATKTADKAVEKASAKITEQVVEKGVERTPETVSEKAFISAADTAADIALSMVGMPYRYRGESPEGFDCSGLVRYSYRAAGVELPHGTKPLKKRTVPVLSKNMQRGDLLFFVQRGRKYSHVGILIGNRRFVHATSSGRYVREDSLDDPYYKKHFLGTRRIT